MARNGWNSNKLVNFYFWRPLKTLIPNSQTLSTPKSSTLHPSKISSANGHRTSNCDGKNRRWGRTTRVRRRQRRGADARPVWCRHRPREPPPGIPGNSLHLHQVINATLHFNFALFEVFSDLTDCVVFWTLFSKASSVVERYRQSQRLCSRLHCRVASCGVERPGSLFCSLYLCSGDLLV